jgi:hypothetical protein
MFALPQISLYKTATILLLIFCTAHTIGGMLLPHHHSPEADAVFASMKTVTFTFNGATCTWYNFWFGFGISASISQLLSATIAWQLDKVKGEEWGVVSGIAWALVASHGCGMVISWSYFHAGAGVLSTVVTGLLALGAWRKGSLAAVAHQKKL